MAPRHRPVDTDQSFPALEEQILERWRERDVFQETLRRREGSPEWVFYEGPPTANGPPGAHHVLSRVFKDIYPRYKTMRGHRVERKGGWDCHGLPVEIAVEKELGIQAKEEIEKYGIAEFNMRCRGAVFEYLEDWNRLTERIGFWIDLEHAYRTLDPQYIESVWWALAQIYEKRLLYEGYKVVPYCPRCGTALSSHEVAQPGSYKDVIDPSVYVRLPVTDAADSALEPGDELLVWTTTPWTLVSNAAVAVDPDLRYVVVAPPGGGPKLVMARDLLERVLGGEAAAEARIDRDVPGRDLVGVRYEPPFPFIPASEYGEKGHTVVPADFVTADDGTGLVHTAIAFGEDDFRLGQEQGLAVVNPVRRDGTYDERIGDYEGRFVKDADADLVADLQSRGRLLRAESYEHAYPHCWRCGTPLLYYAKPSWYIATSQLRDRLLAANETVNWFPEHIKHGRFGDWLANNVDWALSRERYWGTPLPIWRCDNEHAVCVESLTDLEQRSGVRLEDPHRPYVDHVTFPCAECGEEMRRVPEVIDVWFDSGSMPFAQYGYPHHDTEQFQRRFPADFICEALDQTRGWFYSLIAISTLLFDQAPYRNVVCLGLILDDEGRKMSKSLGNIADPWEILNAYGADAFRWYFFTSKQPWDGYLFSREKVAEGMRDFLRQLWNTYAFHVLYANAAGESRSNGDAGEVNDLDRWIESRLAGTVAGVRERMDAYDATTAGREISAFVNDLSNWYVRRSRRRFWEGEPAALETLRHCLVTVAQLLAPFTPFVADEIYENLDGSEPSVHLCDFPEPGERDEALERAMAVAREAVRLGLSARAQAKVKLRQPLREAAVVAAGDDRAAIERLADVVRDELNVKALRFVSAADELGRFEVKPNYRVLGPRFGSAMDQVAAAIAALDGDHVTAALAEGRPVGIAVDGREHELTAEDLQITTVPLEGYGVEREGESAIALDLVIDPELRREGLAREIVRAVQNARKTAGLAVEDRIALWLGGADELLAAAREHEEFIAGETLARGVAYDSGEPDGATTTTIEGFELRIGLARA